MYIQLTRIIFSVMELVSYLAIYLYIYSSVFTFICILDNRILYIANNPGSGYVNRVFDSNLGYFLSFYVTGDYIYALRV